MSWSPTAAVLAGDLLLVVDGVKTRGRSVEQVLLSSNSRPGGNPGVNLKSISHRCYLREVAFEWELTKETIFLPLTCLQGGGWCCQ